MCTQARLNICQWNGKDFAAFITKFEEMLYSRDHREHPLENRCMYDSKRKCAWPLAFVRPNSHNVRLETVFFLTIVLYFLRR